MALIDRHRETRSIAFSLTSNTSVTKSSGGGLLELTFCIDSTDMRRYQPIQTHRNATIQQQHLKSTTTATAARSSQPVQRSRLLRSSLRVSKRQKRRRCASRVTHSPSPDRSGWSAIAPTTRLSGTMHHLRSEQRYTSHVSDHRFRGSRWHPLGGKCMEGATPIRGIARLP